MNIFICFVIGLLFAISINLLLSQQLMRWLFGVVILSSTVNIVILIVGRLTTTTPPIIMSDHPSLKNMANPLPQALILTAIVIGFGLLAFALVLIRRIWQQYATLDSDALTSAELPHYHQDTDTQ